MARYQALRSQREFDRVYTKGRRVSGPFFSFHALRISPQEPTRFGIIIGLKVSKSAVIRNKKKRQIKEIIREEYSLIQSGYWCSIIVYPTILEAEYTELQKALHISMQRAQILL